MSSTVRRRIKSDSNSATTARTLNTSRPTASVGSWTDPMVAPALTAVIQPGNAAGIRLAERSGFMFARSDQAFENRLGVACPCSGALDPR